MFVFSAVSRLFHGLNISNPEILNWLLAFHDTGGYLRNALDIPSYSKIYDIFLIHSIFPSYLVFKPYFLRGVKEYRTKQIFKQKRVDFGQSV